MRNFLYLCLQLLVGLSIEEPTCSPQSQIFQLVVEQNEDEFVVDGEPQVAFKKDDEAFKTLPRGCQKLAGQPSCCKKAFYEQLNEEAQDEASRFKKLEDVYLHLVTDSLDPAINELDGQSKGDMAKQVSEVKSMLEQWKIGEAVKVYIDSCEDPLRLHFSTLSCQLCNPVTPKSLLEGKYMEVDSQACTNLYLPCMRAIGSLEGIAAELGEASRKLKILIKDEGANSENVKHAYTWLSGAARQMQVTYKRAEFYKTRDVFCRKIGQKGFKYDPEDWANLDYMHPSMGPTDAQEAEEKEEEKELQERDKVPAAAGQCIHGFLRENNCICEPCWEGINCDTEAVPGPKRLQPYSPLVAEDVVGSQQPFTVIGCGMATDLNAQLSRLRFLKVDFPGVEEATQAEDPCPLTEPPEGDFLELSLQVPVSATPVRLEYMVQTPTNSEGLYAVCFCHGTECLTVLDESWQRTGYVKVVRTDEQAEEEREKDVEEEEKDPHEGHEKTGPPKCDTQWQRFPMSSIKFSHVEDSVTFHCKEGWQDLQGPEFLACVNGRWMANKGKEQGPWDLQLPRCRWGHRDCPVPKESVTLSGGGYMLAEDGVARYTCPFGSTMLVDPSGMTLEANALVELKAGGSEVQGTVLGKVDGFGHKYRIRWEVIANDKKTEPTIREDDASELWLVVKANVFESFCQPGKIWVPVVSVHCRGGSTGGEREGGEGSTVSELTDLTGHGPCGGTFGVPEVRFEETKNLFERLLGKSKTDQPASTTTPPITTGTTSAAKKVPPPAKRTTSAPTQTTTSSTPVQMSTTASTSPAQVRTTSSTAASSQKTTSSPAQTLPSAQTNSSPAQVTSPMQTTLLPTSPTQAPSPPTQATLATTQATLAAATGRSTTAQMAAQMTAQTTAQTTTQATLATMQATLATTQAPVQATALATSAATTTQPTVQTTTATPEPVAMLAADSSWERLKVSSNPSLLEIVDEGEAAHRGPYSAKSTRHVHKKTRVRRVIKQQSEIDPRTGRPLLKIRKWPIVFTKDEKHSFMVDRCWTSRDCSPPGVVPLDMAAAQRLQPPQESFYASPYLPSFFMGACVLVVILVLLCLRNLWLVSCRPHTGSTKTCFG